MKINSIRPRIRILHLPDQQKRFVEYDNSHESNLEKRIHLKEKYIQIRISTVIRRHSIKFVP